MRMGLPRTPAREAADTLGKQLDEVLKERPMFALLAAAGIGYLFARVMHR